MRSVARLTLIVLAAGCCWSQSRSELPRDLLDLVAIKQKVRQSLTKLPDYTCLQTLERSTRLKESAPFKPVDTLRVEILFSGSREYRAWPGSRNFDEDDAPKVMSGMSSNGEFATHAKGVFVNNTAQITYAGEEVFRGRRALRYSYRLPFLVSGWTLSFSGQKGTVGEHGIFLADAESFDLLRLEIVAEDIPPSIPIASAMVGIEYGRVQIGASQISLPETAELLVIDLSGRQSRNRMAFTQCRNYHAESTVRFEEAPRVGLTIDQNAVIEIQLPANLPLELRLESPIDSRSAMEGDFVMARVNTDAKLNGVVVVPKGALVKGRIRRMESYSEPVASWIVGVEFSEVEFDNKRAEFLGHLDRMDEVPGLSWSLESSTGPELPGVSVFRIEGKRVQLHAGLRMTWHTLALGQR
jgi:hypothetical protein